MSVPATHSIVITGIGVVAPNGIGKEQFWESCFAGVSGIRPITLFDTHPYRCHQGGEIDAFNPEAHLGSKGLRTLDRTTRLALVAAKLALEDAQLDATAASDQDIGVVLGSTTGSIHSITEFDIVGLREGPRYVNPALFPNAVINSPASQVAIRFRLQGLNATIATGFTAGLDAVGYALDMLQLGRARALLVGGVEELCLETFLAFYRLGLLATTNGGSTPWPASHAGRFGTLLGEGAAFVVLEPHDEARRRGVHVYAELPGYGTAFHADSLNRYDPAATAGVNALRLALRAADVSPQDVDYVSAGANATRAADAMEAKAVKTVFPSQPPLSTVKSMLGESFSAAGLLQLAVAVGAIIRQQIPPTINWWTHGDEGELDMGPDCARSARVRRVLVESVAPTGMSSALIMQRMSDA